jgi:hypothetical protein
MNMYVNFYPLTCPSSMSLFHHARLGLYMHIVSASQPLRLRTATTEERVWSPKRRLADESTATRGGVAGGDGPVDVDEQTGVGRGVGAGEGHEGGAGGAGAAGDADLGAGDVQLSTIAGAGAVQGDVLEADKVLAVGNAARHRDGDGSLACR